MACHDLPRVVSYRMGYLILLVIGLCLQSVTAHAYGSMVNSLDKNVMETNTIRQFVQAHNITLQIRHQVIIPSDYSAECLRRVIEDHNASMRLTELNSDLDAELIDPAKVTAFVDGLVHLPQESLALIEGKTISLSLLLSDLATFSPITADALRSGYQLALDPKSNNPQFAAIRIIVPVSPALAIVGMEKAQLATQNQHLSNQARNSAAVVWAAIAMRLLRDNPTDQAALAELANARRALATVSMPPRKGMP